MTILWLQYNVKNPSQTPPPSPDTSPIENLRHILDMQAWEKKFSDNCNIKQDLKKVWLKDSSETRHKLTESKPKRLYSVIEAKGIATYKYGFLLLNFYYNFYCNFLTITILRKLLRKDSWKSGVKRVQKLNKSMPRRLFSVIKAKGHAVY